MEPNTQKPVVVIVEDETLTMRALARLLKSAGVEARTFCSGREFIDRLEVEPAFRIDCVVLALQLWDVCGLEVRNYLARQRPKLPVIFLSSVKDEHIRRRAHAARAAAYFDKPFDGEVLLSTLFGLLKLAPPGRREAI